LKIDFEVFLAHQLTVPHADKLLKELPNLVLDKDGAITIPTSQALHI